jgi:hypothetical protein
MTEDKKCTCGRSLTSKCVGWHDLTEDAWKQKLLQAVQALTGISKQRKVERKRTK